MKRLTFILLTLCIFGCFAQTNKGLSYGIPVEQKTEGKTYALIAGISKYKNPAIPSLQFADKDAVAFRNYLVAEGVDSNNISLLLNEQATFAETMISLDDLCTQKAQAGDKVFIYFSGHGDVESHVVTNVGYLLPYDAPKSVYAVSAINIRTLQDYIATLSAKSIQPIVIIDACHSGNLSGGVEGMKNVQAVLGSKWKEETKILSCQPGELSLEGKQWGNGRGLFSYVLINGMAGMADKNNDGKISLRELNLYLSDKVPDEANPIPQNPVLTGDMNATICLVNKDLLHQQQKAAVAYSNQGNEIKGLDAGLLNGLSDSIKYNYEKFKLCLDTGYLIHGIYPKSVATAYDYYQKIPVNDSTKLLLAIMKNNLATKLANVIVTRVGYMLNNDFAKMGGAYNLLVQTSLLRNLLGDRKLKSLGLFATVLAVEAFTKSEGNMEQRAEARAKIDSAIAFDPYGSHLYFVRALCNRGSELRVKDLQHCIELSPKFIFGYYMMANDFLDNKQADSALIWINKIQPADTPTLFQIASVKAMAFYQLRKTDSLKCYITVFDTITSRSRDLQTTMYRTHIASQIHLAIKDYKGAIRYALYFDQPQFSHNIVQSYILAECYAMLNDIPKCMEYLDKALAGQFRDYDDLLKEENFAGVRQLPEFKALMKKYFPDKYKE